MRPLLCLIIALTAGISVPASAQFHGDKTAPGAGAPSGAMAGGAITTPPANAMQQGATVAPLANPAAGARVGSNPNSTIYMSDAQREAYKDQNLRMGEMQDRYAEVWARAIRHTDESFTETVQDTKSSTLEQVTRSKNGVTLQTRKIMLDSIGRPSEVLIYDGRDQFKYRGMQVYDQYGRFEEEQLYDTENKLLRRRIQEYDSKGAALPVKSVDYVANVPTDLKLVITRESEEAPKVPAAAPPRRGLFGNGRQDAGAPSAPTAPQRAGGEAAPSRGSGLGRIFGGNR